MQGGNTVPTTLFSCYIVRISYQIMRISYHVVRVSYRIAILRLPGFPFSNVFCVYQFYHLLCFAFIMYIVYRVLRVSDFPFIVKIVYRVSLETIGMIKIERTLSVFFVLSKKLFLESWKNS